MTSSIITVHTSRFGDISYEAADVIRFENGLVGFPDLKSFLILNVKEGSVFRWMQSLDDLHFAMLVVQPKMYLPLYTPVISDQDIAFLGIDPEVPVLVYVTATIPKGMPEKMTLNLAGPLVIHPGTGKAMQVVLSDESYTSKHRVFPETEGAKKTAA